jgi:uncharacterized membrane protein
MQMTGVEQETMEKKSFASASWIDFIAAVRNLCAPRIPLIGLVLCLVLWVPSMRAQAAPPAVGDKVSGHMDLGAKQIPLPAGDWVLGGRGKQSFDMPAIGAFGVIENAILFLVRDGRIRAVLEVNSNTLPVNDGWGRTASCQPDRPHFLLITRYKTGWETSCLFGQATRFDAASAGPPAWEQARGYAAKAKLAMPAVWLTAGFRVSDRQDLVDARYHFDPALMLGPAASTFGVADWSDDAIKADPLRRGAVDMISAWASGFDAWIERGLRNQITGDPGPMPEVAAYTTIAPYADAKLRDLDRLYREGRIGTEAYLAQSQAATTEAPVYKDPTSSLLSNTVKKNISFRSFGTFVDYGIAYFVTASNVVSWGIALTLNATDSVWFVLNDQYWDRRYAELNTHDSERLVDFTYLGEGAAP